MSEYKDTLNLPQTDFSMKANLPQQEPTRLAWWQSQQIYKQIRQKQQGKPKFILHDGPPYANGHLHCGHALNKILKDMVVKSKTLSGFDAPFVPGWDCHGLPIELNVEKKMGKAGVKVSVEEFRRQCRSYARSQIDIQLDEFQRLGVFGDWGNPYATMDFSYEAEVVRCLGKLIDKGLVYQGFKPVHWCIDCGSALAEAEVEYEDKRSPAIDVAFYAADSALFLEKFGLSPMNKRVVLPIWTTTPWTLPANEAVCLHPTIPYGLYDTPRGLMIIAIPLAQQVLVRFKVQDAVLLAEVEGATLSGLYCKHPFLEKQIPVILGEHVTVDAGTGAVHTAPAHGVEDYEVSKSLDLTWHNPVRLNGCYAEEVPFFAGVHVFKANDLVIEKLKETETLLALETLTHSYPHCWRHKTPMIFLATPQWFVSMDKTDLREALLEVIKVSGKANKTAIEFIPDWGSVRMGNMISSRPDWCISRQRAWGSPIPVFIHKQTRLPHPKTSTLIQQVAAIIEEKGVEGWYVLDATTLLGEEADEYEKVLDTLDVWFDAGVSHACVLKKRAELHFPADLYLEGSDQYRGWFNSSLTTAMALDGTPPYRSVLTHGYTVDAQGKKLSKSQGNYVELDKLIAQHGADLIRLWVASTDYRHEVSISDEILKRLADAYRRIRNTTRFLLANLFDFVPEQHALPANELLALDKYLLAKAQHLQESIIQAYADYQFHVVYQKVYHFCSIDLGSFYLDIIKDRQYTLGTNSLGRRSCQTVMYHILQALTRWIAPFLSFTAEEIWSFIPAKKEASVFLSTWYQDWPLAKNVVLDEWARLQNLRDEVNKALEIARETKTIGSALAAEIFIYASDKDKDLLLKLGQELRFFLITSLAEVRDFSTAPADAYFSSEAKFAVMVKACESEKCERCWHRVSEVGQNAAHPTLCERCANTVSGVEEHRQYV